MTDRPSRTTRRPLKTWSAFGELGRRPTEYEILTHNLNHTTRAVPLELSPQVNGNQWLRAHRDSIALTVPDWDAFRDPDAITYGRYVAGQDDQETYVEGLLERFDGEGYDETLSPQALDLLRRALTPSRYLAHGLQMLSAYLHQLAISSYVGNCAAFQTADQLRRVQLTAYRTTQLRLAHPDAGFATGERSSWQTDPAWQPIRRAIELALIEFDWDRALVITNLVVKPVAELLLIDQLGRQAAELGAELDALLLENLARDSRRSRNWTLALTAFLTREQPANRSVLQGYLDEFAPIGQAMIEEGAGLLATPDGRPVTGIAQETRTGWRFLVEAAGLVLTPA